MTRWRQSFAGRVLHRMAVPALPLLRDPASRLLPWLMAAMVFLAMMALAGGHVLGGVVDRWTGEISGAATVQIPPLPGAAGAVPADDPRVLAARGALAAHPAVDSVDVLDDAALFRLLEPWLGDTEAMDALPLPRLIDVRLARTGAQDVREMADAVRALVPDARVDDHRTWMANVVDLAQTLRQFARFAVLLVTAIIALVVVLAARSSLTAHQTALDILHMMGATDGFIARQFAKRSLRDAGAGALGGLALVIPALILVQVLAGRVESGLLPPIRFDVGFWGDAFAGTAGLALLAAGSTFVSVLATLRRRF